MASATSSTSQDTAAASGNYGPTMVATAVTLWLLAFTTLVLRFISRRVARAGLWTVQPFFDTHALVNLLFAIFSRRMVYV
ncbi:MAG: hypothetical protein Q9159_001600 [Coniocarpon cinnabarinum]